MADLLDKHSEFTTGAHYLKDHFAIEFIVCKSWIWNNHNEEIDRNYFAKTDTLFKHSFADSYDDLILQIKLRINLNTSQLIHLNYEKSISNYTRKRKFKRY